MAPNRDVSLFLLVLLALPLAACQVIEKAWSSVSDFAGDSWIAALCALLGSLVGGGLGAAVGGGIGAAYQVTRTRMYAAQDLASAFEKGELYGRQAARDLANAAAGAKIDRQVAELAELPWWRSTTAFVIAVVLLSLALRRLDLWPRLVLGPNRLRTLGHVYLGPLCPLPAT